MCDHFSSPSSHLQATILCHLLPGISCFHNKAKTISSKWESDHITFLPQTVQCPPQRRHLQTLILAWPLPPSAESGLLRPSCTCLLLFRPASHQALSYFRAFVPRRSLCQQCTSSRLSDGLMGRPSLHSGLCSLSRRIIFSTPTACSIVPQAIHQ